MEEKIWRRRGRDAKAEEKRDRHEMIRRRMRKEIGTKKERN